MDQDDLFPKEDVQRRFRDVQPPDFSAADSPHGVLADLNLPLYITTNYDDFMVEALKAREKDPVRELCHWNRFVEMEQPSALASGFEPSPATPLVYHLHGHYALPQSLVLTEDDYLDFLVRLSNDQDLLPATIRTALAGTSLLFVGYSLTDWNIRVLFRGLIGSLGASLGMTSIAVQLAPPAADASEHGRQRAQRYLDAYFDTIQKIKVRTYWGDAREFAGELRARWEAFSHA